MLFIERALATERDPRGVAAAFSWAYDEVQRRYPRLTAAMTAAQVDEMANDNEEFAVHFGIAGLDVQRPAVLEYERDIRRNVEQRIEARFGPALEELTLLRAAAQESCQEFHKRAERSHRQEALARLAGRGLLIADEAICLLSAGHAGGALSRWRSLHEVSVVAAVIAENDEETAVRYLRHEGVSRNKAATSYQEHAPGLGEEPLSEATLDEIREVLAALKREYSDFDRYRRDYGWAAHLLSGANPDFRNVEELAGRAWLRPYYQLASHPVHAGAANLLTEIGLESDEGILTGPSPDGLTDPLQLTALTLAFLVSQMLSSAPGEDFLHWELRVAALEKLVERTVERLPGPDGVPNPEESGVLPAEVLPAEEALDDPGQDPPSMLSWPDVSWEEVAQGMPSSARFLAARSVLRRRLRGQSL